MSEALTEEKTDVAVIRLVEKQDNTALSRIIHDVLAPYGTMGGGYASNDPEVETMYETYQLPCSRYFVVEENGVVLGGGGVAPLRGGQEDTCELQKFYLLPDARGKGYGRRLLMHCLNTVREFGFKRCYIETLPEMTEARSLYGKYGFLPRKSRMGDTGHYGCTYFMVKEF